MATTDEPTIELKVFVDKEKSRVLFAESGKEFVDVLFGFLTLPLGTIVRLLGKESQAGCLDELYKSVERLPTGFFRTEACKTMLLNPINGAAKLCCQLKVRVDDTKHREVYVCTSCYGHANCAYSSVPGAVCKCGKSMTRVPGERAEYGSTSSAAGAGSEDGVFVKGDTKFIITDDFKVAPASTSLMLSLLDKFEVQDPSSLEQKTIQLSLDKIIGLLKRSLTSKDPLTGHYFNVAMAHDDTGIDMFHESLHHEQDNGGEHTPINLSISVLQTKNNASVLYAEVGADFVDLLFGLLSIPLGSIVKSYGKCGSKGCVDNLYSSIGGSVKGFLRPECQSFLQSPKLTPFFGCGASKILQVEELSPYKEEIGTCFKCFKTYGFSNLTYCHGNNYRNPYYLANCIETVKTTNLCEMDPKSPKECANGEAYVKQGHQKFIVTDDLHVLPLSLVSTLQVISEAKIQKRDLVEKELAVTKPQVMEILKAALVTRKALSTVLLPPMNMKKLYHHSFGLY
ncbi:hypothetical protein QYE76_005458 [Lolium multiflorum]|uniref:Uncharacterized protein n=1 Tax=Lolium multiflorum TaxID=4521 RepID=A0AAD8W362_LOLMU|nr:hypothetical protein QYE76_005458 [Lolium multiflorum]